MPASNKKEGYWGVRDKNARHVVDNQVQPRLHEPVPGVVYPLYFDRPTYMPEAHARVFLKDAAFSVTDENDAEQKPLDTQALLRVAPEQLRPNMVIADVNELTDAALLTRCSQMPGGQRFNDETAREALVRFLIDSHSGVAGDRLRQNTAMVTDDPMAGEVEDMEEDDPMLTDRGQPGSDLSFN